MLSLGLSPTAQKYCKLGHDRRLVHSHRRQLSRVGGDVYWAPMLSTLPTFPRQSCRAEIATTGGDVVMCRYRHQFWGVNFGGLGDVNQKSKNNVL